MRPSVPNVPLITSEINVYDALNLVTKTGFSCVTEEC